jgi:hypothetical protein
MANNSSLKELVPLTLNDQPLCIFFPKVTTTFKLHSSVIQLLPSFHGLPGEDPHRDLKEFHIVRSHMKPDRIKDGVIKLHAFPFSGLAKDCLYDLFTGSIDNWLMIQRFFLKNIFLHLELQQLVRTYVELGR